MKRKFLGIAICFMALIFVLTLIPAYSAAQDNKININTAGLEELVKLEKIGAVYAKRIIKYRKEHGPFEKIEDLMKVKGIGKVTFAAIKNKITVR